MMEQAFQKNLAKEQSRRINNENTSLRQQLEKLQKEIDVVSDEQHLKFLDAKVMQLNHTLSVLNKQRVSLESVVKKTVDNNFDFETLYSQSSAVTFFI